MATREQIINEEKNAQNFYNLTEKRNYADYQAYLLLLELIGSLKGENYKKAIEIRTTRENVNDQMFRLLGTRG